MLASLCITTSITTTTTTTATTTRWCYRWQSVVSLSSSSLCINVDPSTFCTQCKPTLSPVLLRETPVCPSHNVSEIPLIRCSPLSPGSSHCWCWWSGARPPPSSSLLPHPPPLPPHCTDPPAAVHPSLLGVELPSQKERELEDVSGCVCAGGRAAT